MEKDQVIVEKTYNVPVAMLWKAITDKDQMKQWYFDLSEFKPVVGFDFQFYGHNKEGEKFLHLCKIIEVVFEKKLAYSWRYDGFEGISYVTFELFPEAENTRLKLTHVGLSTFPMNNPSFAKENFVEGWNYLVQTGLKDFVERND